MPAKKEPSKQAKSKKATTTKSTTRKATASAKKPTATKKTAASRKTSTSASAAPARRGDHILIDSPQVGSPPREGEVLAVINGEVSVSYRVRWADGHETLISPAAGSVSVART